MAPAAGGTAVALDVGHVFGSLAASSGFRDPALAGDDVGRCIVVPTGRFVTIRHTESGEVTFIPTQPDSDAITACVVSRDKSLLAVAEKCQGPPLIAVYDLRKEPFSIEPLAVVYPTQQGGGRIVTIAFCADGRYLSAVCVSGSESTAVVLDWRAERVVSSQTLEGAADRILFAPHDAGLLSVSGAGSPRILRLQNAASKSREGSLKLMPPFAGVKESIRIADHSWTEPGDGTLVACATQGALYVLDSSEMTVITTIDPAFQDDVQLSSIMPFSVRCFSQGFIVGGSEGFVAIWERVDAGPRDGDGPAVEFRHGRTIQVAHTDAGTCSVDLCGSEEVVFFGFRSGDVGSMPTATLYGAAPEDVDCALVNNGFHGGPIIAMDVAVQRPLVATACRQDSSIRLWNYSTKTCDLRWQFPGEAPAGVAIHPMGYFLAIAFNDRVSFFHVMLRELKLYRSVAEKSCKLLRYAHGGHLLAAAQNNSVVVFSTRTLERVATLCGHEAHVVSISFDPEDSFLLSCAQNGTLVQWNTSDWSKAETYTANQRDYLLGDLGADGETTCIATYGSKCYVQTLQSGKLSYEQETPDRGLKITAVCRDPASGAMYWGTSSGYIWAYSSASETGDADATMLQRPAEGAELAVHSGSCCFLCLSADGRTLLSAGNDGAVYILSVSGLAGAAVGETGTEAQNQRLMSAADTVLVERAEIQQRSEDLKTLRSENVVLTTKLEEEGDRLTRECELKVIEARKKDQAEIHELLRRCHALEHSTAVKEREAQRVAEAVKSSHEQAKEQLAYLYERKLGHEADRYLMLELDQDDLKDRLAQLKEKGKTQSIEDAEEFHNELARQLKIKHLEIKKHQDIIAFTEHRFEDMLDEEANEHSLQIAEAKMAQYRELEGMKQVGVKLGREQEALQKGLETMTRDKVRMEKDLHEASSTISAMKTQAEELQKTVTSLKTESKDRQATLADKEMKIESYEAKVKKLRKFRHVLNQQLREVTEQLQPKDRMINQLNENLQELKMEFSKQLAEKQNVEAQIQQKRHEATRLQTEGQDLREVLKGKDAIIGRFCEDLRSLVLKQEDLRLWPAEIRRIYHVYVCGYVDHEARLPLEESQRQMRVLERRVTSLAMKNRQTKETCKVDERRKANEGALLLGELNTLRIQKQSLQMTIKGFKKRLAEVEQKLSEELPSLTLPAAPSGVLAAAALGDVAAGRRSPELQPEGYGGPPALQGPSRPHPQGLPRTPSGSLPGPRQGMPSSQPNSSQSARRKVGKALPFENGALAEQQALLEKNQEGLLKQREENKMLQTQLAALYKQRQAERPSTGDATASRGARGARARPPRSHSSAR
eukprot:TRINITY_DN16089_c1_g3_i1.p1 TRINITY_DN16089_c1_g3~~TRINITY_DN16089_c1_g3_i1.p1  ORF type:complete len:1339 (+),score=371.05 TRINITY_DN16089_c1_g3_i1:174-4190(+)